MAYQNRDNRSSSFVSVYWEILYWESLFFIVLETLKSIDSVEFLFDSEIGRTFKQMVKEPRTLETECLTESADRCYSINGVGH